MLDHLSARCESFQHTRRIIFRRGCKIGMADGVGCLAAVGGDWRVVSIQTALDRVWHRCLFGVGGVLGSEVD